MPLTSGDPDIALLSPEANIDRARRQIHQSMAMDEMNYVHTLAIVLNCQNTSKIYKEIYNDKKEDVPVPKVNEEGKEDEEAQAEECNKDEFPYREQFVNRMKYAREWLDLGEVEMGMNKKPLDNQAHQSIMIEVLDINNDKEKL